MHEMTIGEMLLAYEDAMELYVITNPWGDGKATSSGSSSANQGDATLTSSDVQERGLGTVQTVSDISQLPPHLQDFITETVIGKEVK